MLPRPRSTPRSGRPACTGRPAGTSCSTPSSSVVGSPESPANAASGSTSGPASRSSNGSPARSCSTTADGATVRAGHVVVATSAYSGWLRRLSPLFVPVYDYVLVSEPLDPERRAAIGWERRQGLTDGNNQFHYFRLTADDRILWGGYDAIHHYGSKVGPELDRRPETFERARGAVLPHLPPARWTRLPVSLGRRDRHDVAVHRHVRPDDGRARDVRARLHRASASGRAGGPAASCATSSCDPTRTGSGCGS